MAELSGSGLRDRAREMLALVEVDVAERRWELDERRPSEQWWRGYRQALADLLWEDGT